VTKFTAIIPVCIIAVSGCALLDSSQMSDAPAELSAPVEENQPPSVIAAAPVSAQPVTAAVPRSVTAEDVRRVQLRLRELGFDPGPVDGVAGAKTKAAFSRLQSGCAKLEPFGERPPVDKIPAREDVVRIQSELRSAGFNPGPVDGVYGARTKSMVAQLPGACLMAKEFSAGLDGSAQIAANENPVATVQEGAKSVTAGQGATVRHDATRDAAPAQSQQAREDIRILQLRLRDAGFDPGPFDGVIGAKTKAALAQYEASQRNSKIKTSLTTTRISGQY
jgi:peptidoglycan hydrolase-like protein with peptidoglycan-binding domain